MNFLSPIILISTFVPLVLSNEKLCNMTFAVDNEAILYIDGTQKPDLIYWPQSRNVIFPCYSSVIAIHAWNVYQSSPVPVNTAAFIVSSDDDYIMTNTSWKCSNVSYPGWTNVDYDDSFWSNPTSYGTRDEYTNGYLFRNTIKPNAHWIWLRQFRQDSSSKPFKDMDVIIYCRKTLRKYPISSEHRYYSTGVPKKRVCYFTGTAQSRAAPAMFLPDSVDPSLCTHINFAYVLIDTNNQMKPESANDDGRGGMYEKALALRNRRSGLKVLLALGGGTFGMEQISKMLSSSSTRSTCINSAIRFLRSRGFDGIDVNFAFPGSRGSKPEDKQLFTTFLQELRTAINKEAATSGNTALLLTAAVSSRKHTIERGYEIPLISQSVDFLNVMSYDFNGGWDSITGLNAPLYPRADEHGVIFREVDRNTRNLDWCAKYWVNNGAPKDKLVLGLSFYGRSFTLTDVSQNGLGAPAKGSGQKGSSTQEEGLLAYYEICGLITRGATRGYSTEQQAPYAYLGDQWVGYDDTTSLQKKVDYIKNNGYAGWHVRNIDFDDFSGSVGCNAGPYPLLGFLNRTTTDGETPYDPPSSDEPPIDRSTTATEKDENDEDDDGGGGGDSGRKRRRRAYCHTLAIILAVVIGILLLLALILLILICCMCRRTNKGAEEKQRDTDSAKSPKGSEKDQRGKSTAPIPTGAKKKQSKKSKAPSPKDDKKKQSKKSNAPSPKDDKKKQSKKSNAPSPKDAKKKQSKKSNAPSQKDPKKSSPAKASTPTGGAGNPKSSKAPGASAPTKPSAAKASKPPAPARPSKVAVASAQIDFGARSSQPNDGKK